MPPCRPTSNLKTALEDMAAGWCLHYTSLCHINVSYDDLNLSVWLNVRFRVDLDPIDCALDLMRRLPPQHVQENVANLLKIAPDLHEDLLSAVDQPLKIARDASTGRDYLLCDYNRDGDSYRSPWSNEYNPPLQDGTQPSPQLRRLELAANTAFDTYRELYFEGGVSSVYMWDLPDGFATVVLIKKSRHLSGALATRFF